MESREECSVVLNNRTNTEGENKNLHQQYHHHLEAKVNKRKCSASFLKSGKLHTVPQHVRDHVRTTHYKNNRANRMNEAILAVIL